MIFEGSTKRGIEYCKNEDGILCYLRAIQGHSGGIPIEPEKWITYLSFTSGKSTYFTDDTHGIFSSYWEKDWFQEAKRKIKPVRQSFQHQRIRYGNDAGGRSTSWWLFSPTESTLCDQLETQPRCCTLGTIAVTSGSRIGILANEIMCNHDLHNNTRSLHWSCDYSKRRTCNFREAWNSKAGTKGNVEKELAKPSSSSSSSGPLLTQTYLASGNRGWQGKTRQEYKMFRTTPQTWT